MIQIAAVRKGLSLAACLLGAGLLHAGCTGSSIPDSRLLELRRQVETRGLIIGLEGLQPGSGHRADDLTLAVAEELELAQSATSGNPKAHLQLILDAHANGQPVYIVGYSLGGISACKLAKMAQDSSVPIDGLFLLDPGAIGRFHAKIPANVRKVVFYLSGGVFGGAARNGEAVELLEDPQKTLWQVVNLSSLNHLNLPAHVAENIRGEIAALVAGEEPGEYAIPVEEERPGQCPIADRTQAIELDPKDAAAHYSHANAYVDNGDYARAIVRFAQAIGLDLKDTIYSICRDQALNRKGDWRYRQTLSSHGSTPPQAVRPTARCSDN